MDLSPVVRFLTANLETKEKSSKFVQYLLKFYLVDNKNAKLRDLVPRLSGARKIMKLSATFKGLTNLSKALETDDMAQKILHTVGAVFYFSDDLDILMGLGVKLPQPLEALGRQATFLWFLKSFIALCIAIENNRTVVGNVKEKRLVLLKYICEVLHSTNDLDWQSRDKLSFAAACISAALAIRAEVHKVNWSPLVNKMK